ncbi:hypothetical protein OSB94_13325 [Proteus vulgaris]|uniref:hypothetical protein n=1 Tax=Proteus vulgaris TaxID=585 RepID=UPI002877169E|nr:hypothetical protein [Proteus vulgaris]MDS0789078.1 hypothetical protein [Proteus vulgaris]
MLTNQLEVYNVVDGAYSLERQLNIGDKIIFAASKNESLNIINYYQAEVANIHGVTATLVAIGNISLIDYKLEEGVEIEKAPSSSIGSEKPYIARRQIIKILK